MQLRTRVPALQFSPCPGLAGTKWMLTQCVQQEEHPGVDIMRHPNVHVVVKHQAPAWATLNSVVQ